MKVQSALTITGLFILFRYCRCNARCSELERLHKDKVEIVRKSYRSQLNNAIQKIAGEYQVMSVCFKVLCECPIGFSRF